MRALTPEEFENAQEEAPEGHLIHQFSSAEAWNAYVSARAASDVQGRYQRDDEVAKALAGAAVLVLALKGLDDFLRI